jgi:hypothetical protein
MNNKTKYKAWFLLCPIYTDGNDYEMSIEERWKCLSWLLDLCFWLHDLYSDFAYMFNPYHEVGFPVLITGECHEC